MTPVTITEIDAPSADEPETRDTALAIAAVIGGLGLLLHPLLGFAPPPIGSNRSLA